MPFGRLAEVLQSKELNELAEKLKANNEALERQNSAIAELEKRLASLDAEVSKISEANRSVISSIQTAESSIKGLNEELADSISDLKILKTQLQSKIGDKIEAEFKALLSRFEKDVESVSKLSREMQGITTEVATLKTEIEKLTKIGSTVKTMDFELTNYAKRLTADDAEKLRLMRQIDTLERMISKLRRRDQPKNTGPQY